MNVSDNQSKSVGMSECEQLKTRLADETDALVRVHKLSEKVLEPGGLDPLLQEVMETAVVIMRAERGTLQLLEEDSLRIVASYGHQPEFLEFFASAENRASACGTAMSSGERVIVPDIETSPLFVGTPSLAVLRDAGVRAVQSTPMTSRNGVLMGILTTQWALPHTPAEHDLWRIDLLARQAVDLIQIKQVEAALRKSNELLARAERVANMGSWEWNVAQNELYWSEQVYRIFGLSRHQFQPSEERFYSLIHPDDRGRVRQAVENSLKGEKYWVEFRITSNESSIRYLVSQGDVDLDQNGKPNRMIGIVEDITERKATEARLAYLASFPENNPNPVVETEIDGRVRYANPSALRLFPGLRENGTGHPWLVGSEDLLRSIQQGDTSIRERDVTVGDRTFHQVLQYLPEGSGIRMYGLDLTGQKQAEAAQKESEERIRTIISTLPVGVAVMDASGRTVLANKAMEQIWGASTAAPEFPVNIDDVGRYKGWWAETGMPLAAGDWASSRALTRGETSLGEIIDVEHFDGTRGTILNSAAPLRDAGGNVNGAVVAAMDITELRSAQNALQEADRRKDEYLAMLAHELRNPLAAISSAIELVKQRGSPDPALDRAFQAAVRQASHMKHLLDDLLDVARITQGKVMLEKKEVSLLSVMESALDASNPLMNARKHRLYVSHSREPMHVFGDPVRLSQSIGNLLHNAAKFTPPGGEIYLVVERRGDRAVILVRDNGKGIDTDLLPHIFDVFVQGSRGSDRVEGGLGIGLTLVRSIAQLHGGGVEARSDGPGRGSEFRIWLPLLPVIEDQQLESTQAKAVEAKPLRILVVDDNTDSLEMMSALLEIAGHKVVTAQSGPEAIDIALRHHPEVALVDIGMPGMDGYELAQLLRNAPELMNLSLVAVSGYGRPEDIRKSREAGFNDHLVKPVDWEILQEMLRKLACS